jgi:hypothetical protein
MIVGRSLSILYQVDRSPTCGFENPAGLENSATLLSWDFGRELVSDQAQF